MSLESNLLRESIAPSPPAEPAAVEQEKVLLKAKSKEDLLKDLSSDTKKKSKLLPFLSSKNKNKPEKEKEKSKPGSKIETKTEAQKQKELDDEFDRINEIPGKGSKSNIKRNKKTSTTDSKKEKSSSLLFGTSSKKSKSPPKRKDTLERLEEDSDAGSLKAPTIDNSKLSGHEKYSRVEVTSLSFFNTDMVSSLFSAPTTQSNSKNSRTNLGAGNRARPPVLQNSMELAPLIKNTNEVSSRANVPSVLLDLTTIGNLQSSARNEVLPSILLERGDEAKNKAAPITKEMQMPNTSLTQSSFARSEVLPSILVERGGEPAEVETKIAPTLTATTKEVKISNTTVSPTPTSTTKEIRVAAATTSASKEVRVPTISSVNFKKPSERAAVVEEEVPKKYVRETAEGKQRSTKSSTTKNKSEPTIVKVKSQSQSEGEDLTQSQIKRKKKKRKNGGTNLTRAVKEEREEVDIDDEI